MADNYDIGPKIGIEGEKEYKSAINDINKDMAILGSELGKVAAQFDLSGDSMEGTRAKADVLSRQVETQKEKIESLKAALANAAESFGETDNRTKNWQIALNKAEAELAQTEKALQDVGNDTEKVGDEFDTAGKKALSFGDVLKANVIGDVITSGIRALGNAISNAASELVNFAKSAMDSADELQALSDKTGFTTEQLQIMKFQGDDLGVSLDTMTSVQGKLIKNMDSAANGTGAAAEAFKQLGISVKDSDGNLRNSNDVYGEVLTALSKVTNETEATAIAQKIFGKSAAELNPLIKAGGDGLAALAEQAKATGAVMEGSTITNLDSLGDTMDHLKQSAESAAGSFLAQFAPSLNEVATALTGMLSGTVSVDEFLSSIGTFITQVSTTITQKLPDLIKTGGEILLSIIKGIVEALPQIIPAATDIILKLVDQIIKMLPQIIDAGLQVIIQLALGIAQALPELIPTIVDAMLTIVTTLIDNIDLLIDAAIAIIIALAEGIIQNLPKLIEKIPEIIIKLVKAIIENLPKLLEAAIQLIVMLAKYIVENLGKLVEAGWDIIKAVGEGIAKFATNLWDIGKNIVSGIWEGIKNAASWLWDKVSGFFNDLINNVLGFLGIHSPSRVFAGIGNNMALGLGEGFTDSMNAVTKDMQKAIPADFEMTGTYKATAMMGESIVNGLAGMIGGQSAGSATFNIVLPNGQTLASFIYDPLKNIIKQKGEALG